MKRARDRTPRGWSLRSLLVALVGPLRRRFYGLLVLLGALGLAPWLVAGRADRLLSGAAQQIDLAGSLRYRLLAVERAAVARAEGLDELVAAQDRALDRLIAGDETLGLPPCRTSDTCARLREHRRRWRREIVASAEAAARGEARGRALHDLVRGELGRLDDTVHRMADAAHEDLLHVMWWGGATAIVSGVLVLLVAAGVWDVFGRIRRLGTATRAPGGTDASTEVERLARGVDEVAELARALAAALRELRSRSEAERQRLGELVAERTRALQQSREFLEVVLDSIEQPVLVVDRDGVVVGDNRAARRTYGHEVVGLRYAALPGRPDTSLVERTFQTGRPASAELPQRIGERQEVVHVETCPVRANDGRVDKVVEITRVVTEEKRMQVQMMHQEKMAAFGLLAAGVAHEIGNPLASILSQIEMTRRSGNVERMEHSLAVVEREMRRIARVLRDLVDFTRRPQGDDAGRIDVNAAVRDVARLLAHDPRARMVEIRLTLARELPPVTATSDAITQVLVNLGVNALDAMAGGGTLTFETAPLGGDDRPGVRIRVADTGHGVPDQVRERLFEPFITTKPRGRGTGLGLFVSKGIVEGLGGSLVLEHTDAGGTVFAVRLPAGSERGLPPTRPQRAASSS